MISSNAKIAPTCVIADDVAIEDGVEIGPFCVVNTGTTIGRDTRIGPNCVIGGRSTMIDRSLEAGTLEIGAGNVFGPHCIVDAGFLEFSGRTRIGQRNTFVSFCHVGHDCRIGDDNTLGAGCLLSGHVTLGDDAYLTVGVFVHQRRKIGDGAFVGARSQVKSDIPPFIAASGEAARYRSINKVGLQRQGRTPYEIRSIHRFYRGLRTGAEIERADSTDTADVNEARRFLTENRSALTLVRDRTTLR